MTNCCPACGQSLPVDGDLIVDPAGIVTSRGRFTVLTKQEHSILDALMQSAPRHRTREQLLQDLYWERPDEPEIKIIDVFVCKLRKKLAPLGVTIQTGWGRGYRFVPASKGEAA